jgi:hypothetical protein
MLQHPKICAFKASSSLRVNPPKSISLSWSCVILSSFLFVSALSVFDLSINAAISLGSNISFFSNSETCFTSVTTFSGFCFVSFFVSIFLTVFSGNGNDSGF